MNPDRLAKQLTRALEDLPRLSPFTLAAKIDQYRGGIANANLDGGGKSADTPLPQSDATDRAANRDEVAYSVFVQTIAECIESCVRIQNWWLIPAEMKEAERKPECATCSGDLDFPRKRGECARCRVHRHRYGATWPAKREQRAS